MFTFYRIKQALGLNFDDLCNSFKHSQKAKESQTFWKHVHFIQMTRNAEIFLLAIFNGGRILSQSALKWNLQPFNASALGIWHRFEQNFEKKITRFHWQFMTLYTFNWIVVMLSYLNKILLNLKRVVESQHHDTNKSNYHSMHFFLPFHWPRAHHVTWNNCLQMMVCSCVVTSKRVLVQIIFCSCVIGTTFSREN